MMVLNSKIQAIKFFRTLAQCGLVEAKAAVELWSDATGNIGCVTGDAKEVALLALFAGKIAHKEWGYATNKFIVLTPSPEVTRADVSKLLENLNIF